MEHIPVALCVVELHVAIAVVQHGVAVSIPLLMPVPVSILLVYEGPNDPILVLLGLTTILIGCSGVVAMAVTSVADAVRNMIALVSTTVDRIIVNRMVSRWDGERSTRVYVIWTTVYLSLYLLAWCFA